jgi:hypothetical protein
MHSAISHALRIKTAWRVRVGDAGEFLIDRVLTQPSAKADIGKAEARRRRADLDSAPILVHMVLIDCWPNDLGRFASSLTGAHVSDLFSKIDQLTKVADPRRLSLTCTLSMKGYLREYWNREVV